MPQTCWCSCLPVYQISFFPPISDMMSLLCHKCSVLVPWVWTGTCPSPGVKVRRFLPSTVPLLEGEEPLDLLGCLHDDHLSAVKEKTGMAKSSSPGCWLQHTEWNPGAAAARSSLEWVWEAPWQRGGFDAHPKHTAALGTEQFEVVCPVTTSCGQNCQIVISF